MGQQQLLLLVLGIVIVGLAVVVGIQAFGENQKKANADAITNDVVRIASDAQAWVLKPTAFGGGNGAPAGLDAAFAKLGYTPGNNGGTTATAGPDEYENLNGVYAIAASGTGSTGLITITGSNVGQTNYVRADVFGPSPNCMVTQQGNAAITAAASRPSGCTF